MVGTSAAESTGTTNSYASTLGHIALIAGRRAKLLDAQLQAERQLVHRIACDYMEGRLSDEGLCAAYEQYREVALPGFSKRWNERVPVAAADVQALRRAIAQRRAMVNGAWHGVFPWTGDCVTPRDGVCVVYVLFDAHNVPCYVGSSQGFRGRANQHAKQGKQFVRWMAYPCADREAAYELEERLLQEHKPYLNRRTGR